VRLVDATILDALFIDANKSERLRSHYLLHSSHEDRVQRLLIALVYGSFVEPHYHQLPSQWEMFTVIKGQIEVALYDDLGSIREQFLAGEGTDVQVVEFSPGDIHSVKCTSKKALMLEVKEGPFDPAFAKSFPKW